MNVMALVPIIFVPIVFIIVVIGIVASVKNNKSINNEEFTGENSEFIDLIKNGLKGENSEFIDLIKNGLKGEKSSKKNHKCEYCGSVHSGTKCPNCGATRTE